MKGSMQRVRTIDLVPHQMLVIEGARAGRVRMLAGAAWLTHENEAGDSVVQAGAEVALAGGRTLIEALGPARLQVDEARLQWRAVWQQLRRGLRRHAARWQLGPVAAQG